MSEAIPKSHVDSDQETVDTSWVDLAEGTIATEASPVPLDTAVPQAPVESVAQREERIADVREHLASIPSVTPEAVPVPTAEKSPEANEFGEAIGANASTRSFVEDQRNRRIPESKIALRLLSMEMDEDTQWANKAGVVGLIAPASIGMATAFGPLGAEMVGAISHETLTAFMAAGGMEAVVACAIIAPILGAGAWLSTSAWNVLKERRHRNEYDKRFRSPSVPGGKLKRWMVKRYE